MSSARPILTTPSEIFALAGAWALAPPADKAPASASASIFVFVFMVPPLKGYMLFERLADDLQHAARHAFGVADALQHEACLLLPPGIELFPAVEGARHAGRYLRVEPVQGDDLVRHEAVAGAVGRVK